MALARRYDDFFRRAAVVAVADSSGGPSGVRGVRGALTTLPAAHGAAARVPRDRVCTLGRPCMRVRVHAVQLRTCQATWVAPPARAGSVMGWSVGVPELTGASGTRVAVALSPVRAPLRPAPAAGFTVQSTVATDYSTRYVFGLTFMAAHMTTRHGQRVGPGAVRRPAPRACAVLSGPGDPVRGWSARPAGEGALC